MEYSKQKSEKKELFKQPDFETPPKVIDKTYSRKGILHVAGEGDKDSDIMFIATALQPEEARTAAETTSGVKVKIQPRYMRGPAGSIFKDTMLDAGIDIDEHYYTAVCKWLMPGTQRARPKKEALKYATPALESEIRTVNPKIIVCMGKVAFDLVMDLKLSLKDARGGWFRSKKYDCLVYLMEDIYKLISKPELVEAFRVDGVQIKRMLSELNGVSVHKVETEYEVIINSDQLKELVAKWKAENRKVISVDCEWGGNNHIDGNLRSVQFCWDEGKAAYLRFMDDNQTYRFDVSYREAGEILAEWLDKPDVKYIGHHFSADAPWLHTWLGLEWYQKCIFDSEFAQQTVNEFEELSLERLAMKYTDLGRYDIDLTLWKKKNKLGATEGYANIPDDILIPYALKDVDTVYRAWPKIKKAMEAQDLTEYYEGILNPFVTDVFTCFALVGLPMDIERMDDMRELYTFARDKLNEKFVQAVHAEARTTLFKKMFEIHNEAARSNEDLVALYEHIENLIQEGEVDSAWNDFKRWCGKPDLVIKLKALFDHFVESRYFNIRSTSHMRRWLFDVKGYQPIKSTNRKADGLPAVNWEKVLEMPPEVQKKYSPAVDKQSLQILSESHDDPLLRKLLQLSAVGNICKAFLKEADVNKEGQLIRENGLHFFLCSDNRVHGQMSTTETGRPRSWKPNSLNWPSYVNEMVSSGIGDLLKELYEKDNLPERFRHYLVRTSVGQEEISVCIPSLRSCVKAPQGYCFVESDYATAEIRGLAYISGDENLIRLVSESDTDFAISVDADTGKEHIVRLKYPESIISPEQRDNRFLFKGSEATLVHDGENNLRHPPHDLHWSLAEMVHRKPREVLNKDIDRKGLGKVGNFSSAYGASPGTLERKIEQDTGVKPEPGTGQALLDALSERQPVAQAWLKSLERVPNNPGFYRAASGRVRHFALHEDSFAARLNKRDIKSMSSSQGREARNFPMQESVAATAARAGKWLLAAYKAYNMEARPMIILYDSVVTLCPLHERFKVAELHQMFMTDCNTWEYHGRTMNYPIDTDLCYRWSTKPTKEEKEQLEDKTWKVEKEACTESETKVESQ